MEHDRPCDPLSLGEELRSCGLEMDVGAFRSLVTGVFAEMFPGRGTAYILFRPRKAIRFCKAIRERCGAPLLTEAGIMYCLTDLAGGFDAICDRSGLIPDLPPRGPAGEDPDDA